MAKEKEAAADGSEEKVEKQPAAAEQAAAVPWYLDASHDDD